MTEIIGFCNQKGGVGKTTTAINLAASLAVAEKRILLIDLDPQGNATNGLGFNKSEIKSNSYSMIMGQDFPVPQKTALEFLDLIPASTDLVGAEIELVNLPNREQALRNGIKRYTDYDCIFVDGPPSLGLLTLNLLTAVSGIVIPVQSEFYALEGLTDLLRTFDLVKKELNPSLAVKGILLTMYDARNNLARDVDAEIRKHFGALVFRTVIPRSVRLSEAPSHGKPVILYDIKSAGAQSYLQLAREFLEP